MHFSTKFIKTKWPFNEVQGIEDLHRKRNGTQRQLLSVVRVRFIFDVTTSVGGGGLQSPELGTEPRHSGISLKEQ